MDRVDITFKLSRELTEQARAAGILDDEWLERLISAELDRRVLDPLNLTEPPMTMEQIQEEVDAVRRERRERRAAQASASLPPGTESPPATD